MCGTRSASREVCHLARPNAGFTLLELLVAIAIIGVLISLTLPAFAAIRSRARITASQSNVKQLSTFVMLYAGGNRDLAPIAERQRLYESVVLSGSYGMPHWDAFRQWPGVLLEAGVVERRVDAGVFVSPGWRVNLAHHNGDYALSLSFAGNPALWSGDATWDDAGLEVSQRLSAVRSPSSKALLWDARAGHLGRLIEDVPTNDAGDLDVVVPIGRADGSSVVMRPSQTADAVSNPRNLSPSGKMRLHNTPSGIDGVDFTR